MPLTGGEVDPPLPDLFIEALLQPIDETICTNHLRCLLHPLSCPWIAHGDVVGNGTSEEIGILQHDADLAAQCFEGQSADVDSINGYRTSDLYRKVLTADA